MKIEKFFRVSETFFIFSYRAYTIFSPSETVIMYKYIKDTRLIKANLIFQYLTKARPLKCSQVH